jgi:translation initiation factor IF-3
MDYGQWQYKQARTQTNKAKKIEIKVIQLSLKIGQHDIDVRVKRTEQFFAKGDKVKVVLRLRGREKTRKDLAADIIRNFVTALGPDVVIEKPLSFQGAELSITIGKK